MSWSRKRTALALLCAAVAALAMALYASGIRAEATESRQRALTSYGGDQIEVFVATRDIAAGETLSADNVSSQLWLSDLLPEGALGEQKEVFGQMLALPLLCNEPVVAAKLGDGSASAEALSVPAGFCAVSIPTDDVLAVGGAIRVGSIIMVYAAGPSAVELLAEDVLVLETSNGAIDGTSAATSSGSRLFGDVATRKALAWVTLAIEPHRVQELIAASRDKSLYLVLPGTGIGLEDLETGDDPEPGNPEEELKDADSGTVGSNGDFEGGAGAGLAGGVGGAGLTGADDANEGAADGAAGAGGVGGAGVGLAGGVGDEGGVGGEGAGLAGGEGGIDRE
ncbi:MAG: Flp pilus assembly protein CpaB [Coriobacteriales bacterium]|jgi:pilus assembly protein CpaB|nr:Flp pilus assembly protein CpaB [Coriobacteriales bacterium]